MRRTVPRVDEGRADTAVRWLRALARDVLEHESCDGCRKNAAQALDDLGLLTDVLHQLDVPDPRAGAARPPEAPGSAYRSRLTIQMDDE